MEDALFFNITPLFRHPGKRMGKNQRRPKLHWNVDRYFTKAHMSSRWAARRNVSFHRTLTSYINTIIKAGFQLEAVEEPRPSKRC
ncbi:hypothetical protein PO124_11975 [Bacillus licheniformis]|nr:hypothetical protein [Bacillus licheniformis]